MLIEKSSPQTRSAHQGRTGKYTNTATRHAAWKTPASTGTRSVFEQAKIFTRGTYEGRRGLQTGMQPRQREAGGAARECRGSGMSTNITHRWRAVREGGMGGGGGEIRTRGTLRPVGFQDRCIRPLCHPSFAKDTFGGHAPRRNCNVALSASRRGDRVLEQIREGCRRVRARLHHLGMCERCGV